MHTTTHHHYPLDVGDTEAVRILFEKIHKGHEVPSDERYRRLHASVQRAMELQDDGSRTRIEEPERQAFIHGLITGYSVAMAMMGMEAE